MRALEFSLRVRSPEQFFLWTQGFLQALIPHDILFCRCAASDGQHVRTERYTAEPGVERAFADVCASPDGLLATLREAWERTGHVPLLVSAWDTGLPQRASEALARHRLDTCAVHGMPAHWGAPASFFCFAGVAGPLAPRHAHLLDLALPSLHAAFLRTLHAAEPPRQLPHRGIAQHDGHALHASVTGREVQVLKWMQEGKSNREIAQILSISALTVKNHVQNILRKLAVRNRTQAVSYALAARTLRTVRDAD